MLMWMTSVTAARPQFLVGFFIGICLSSAAMQGVLLALGLGGLHEQLLPDSLPPGRQLNHPDDLSHPGGLPRPDQPPGGSPDYEVHNLGLRLHSAEETPRGLAGDHHVVRYFQDDDALPAVDHYDSLGGEELAAGKEAGRGTVYVGVITDRARLAEQAAVVRMTWGAELPIVQFFFDMGEDGEQQAGRNRREHMREVVGLPDISAKDTFTSKHTSEVLRHVCSRHHDDHLWYVLVRDATYVSTSGLLRILDRMSPSEDLVVGHMDSAHDGPCSASPGIIFSSRAMSRICPRLSKCSDSPNMERCLGIQCISSKKISPDLHVTSEHGHVDVGELVGDADDPRHLSDQAIFIGTLPSTRDFYRLHLHFTRVRITRTQEVIHRLGQELSRTRRSVKPKRDKSLVHVQETAIFDSDALLNKTSEPFYQFIDNSGKLYLDTCKVRKQDVGREASSPYRAALELAKKSIGTIAEGLNYFTYKVTKPNMGIEYQFYFIQTLTHNPTIGSRKKPTREKVHQVTILHPYGKLEMESKEIQPVKMVNFVIPATGFANSLNSFLDNYEQVCLAKSPDRCSLLIVIFCKTHDMHDAIGLRSEDVRRKLLPLEARYPDMRSQVMEVAGESMTLARTVQMADSAFEREDLLVFLPPDMRFTEDFLYRCQLNTLSTKRAYFPVVYQRYATQESTADEGPGSLSKLPVNLPDPTEGYWANSDFATFSAYNEDIQMFDNLPSSARDLHNMFKASEYMGVFRAPDPGLTRQWRMHVCSMSNSVDRKNCMKELKYMNMQ